MKMQAEKDIEEDGKIRRVDLDEEIDIGAKGS